MLSCFQTGLDQIIAEPSSALAGRRFGLLFNQASLTGDGRYAADALAACYGHGSASGVRKLFSPQHGVWGEEQANMIETGHSRYLPLDLPLFSLYSETRRPSPAMLEGIDALVIDLQDVGTRVYTFIWTMLECMRACADDNVAVIVLDRPNPLGGQQCEGLQLESAYRSFVGLADIPMRHGLTMGELAKWFQTTQAIEVDLTVIRMQGWSRSDRFPETGRHWTCPSPNMPSYRSTVVYPGGVLLEGTNLSEGRGTTIPFEVVGAPFVDELALARELNEHALPGVRFRPTRFKPTFDKWSGQSCRGIYLDVTDAKSFESYRSMLHIIWTIRKQSGDQFEWLPPPYEYETVKPPIDILTGSEQVRSAIDQQCSLVELDRLAITNDGWWSSVSDSLLYVAGLG